MYYPDIDPVVFSVAGFNVYWYGILYLVAFFVFYTLGRVRLRTGRAPITVEQFNDVVFYWGVGVIVGGRLGFVFFYDFSTFLADPLWLFRIWEGGLSFHGGFLGVLLVTLWRENWSFSRFIGITDFIAPLVPLGIGCGRLGNFINTELPGRVTESALGVHFPCDAVLQHNFLCIGEYEEATRHVSSLYQASMEGVVLFVLIWLFSTKSRGIGMVSGAFLVLAGTIRFGTELFRQPDAHIGFLLGDWMSMGQVLSVPLIGCGVLLCLPWMRQKLEANHVG